MTHVSKDMNFMSVDKFGEGDYKTSSWTTCMVCSVGINASRTNQLKSCSNLYKFGEVKNETINV